MNAWRIVELMGVLSEETRFAIVAMLVQAGEDGMPQNRIGTRTGLALPRLRRHLAKLVKAGLIRRNHRRKGIVWKVDERQLGGLIEAMAAKLKPQVSTRIGQTAVIEAPAGFRTLASKLKTVVPADVVEARPRRSRTLPRALSAPRRLPARLTEAIAEETDAETISPASVSEPEPMRSVEVTLTPALPAPASKVPAKAESSPRHRRHPVRLSDAIAEVSG